MPSIWFMHPPVDVTPTVVFISICNVVAIIMAAIIVILIEIIYLDALHCNQSLQSDLCLALLT